MMSERTVEARAVSEPNDDIGEAKRLELYRSQLRIRDAEQRAVYDRLLKFERERLRRRLKSTASYLVRSVVSDAVAVVGCDGQGGYLPRMPIAPLRSGSRH